MRGQGAFEYVLMLSGVMLTVVTIVFLLQSTTSSANSTLGQNQETLRSLFSAEQNYPGVWPVFAPPTPADGATASSPAISIVVRQKDSGLYRFLFNWDGAGYDYYNSSLALMLGLDNNPSLWEGASNASDSSPNALSAGLNGPSYSDDAKYGSSLLFDGSDDYAETDPYAAQNLVANPSFEAGSSPPTSWSCAAPYSISTDSHTGSRSIQLDGSTTSATCTSANFQVKPDTYYKISYWAKRPSAPNTNFVITDFQGFAGSARGSEGSIGGWSQFPAGEWAKKEYLVRTFSGATSANIAVRNYNMNGPVYFDDVSVQEVTPEFRNADGALLDWSERIVSGTYTQSFNFGFQQQAIRTLNFTAFLHANRMNFGSNTFAQFDYNTAPYPQQSGRVTLYCNYFYSGSIVVEVRNSTSAWEPIGTFSATGTYNYDVPAKYYPSSGPLSVRLRASSSTSMQVSSFSYASPLGGSPANAYGYTKVSPLDPTDGFSFEAWVKPQSCNSGYVLGKSLRSTVGQYRVYCSSGSLYFSLMDRDFNWRSVSTAASNGAWQHVVGTWNGANIVLYVNGQQKATAAASSITSWPSNVEIGASEAAEHFNGRIDEVRLWNRALAPEEAALHYSSSFRRIQDGYWQFDYSNASLPSGAHTYGYVSVGTDAKMQIGSRTVNG